MAGGQEMAKLEGSLGGTDNDPGSNHDRPVLGRPLWRPGRRPARGHGVVRQVHRRLAHQHRLRHRAAGATLGRHHRRGRRAHGPLRPRATGPRGRGRDLGQDRSRPLDRAGAAGHPRRGQLPTDLLPRALRRHGADRGRHRRGLRRAGALRHRDPDAPAPIRRSRPRRSARCGWRARTGHAPRSTSTTGRTFGAWPATARARAASSRAPP